MELGAELGRGSPAAGHGMEKMAASMRSRNDGLDRQAAIAVFRFQL
jgi:hypothetical protein